MFVDFIYGEEVIMLFFCFFLLCWKFFKGRVGLFKFLYVFCIRYSWNLIYLVEGKRVVEIRLRGRGVRVYGLEGGKG